MRRFRSLFFLEDIVEISDRRQDHIHKDILAKIVDKDQFRVYLHCRIFEGAPAFVLRIWETRERETTCKDSKRPSNALRR